MNIQRCTVTICFKKGSVLCACFRIYSQMAFMEHQGWMQILLGNKYTYTVSMTKSDCSLRGLWGVSEGFLNALTDKDYHSSSCRSQKIPKQAHSSPYPHADSHRTPCILYLSFRPLQTRYEIVASIRILASCSWRKVLFYNQWVFQCFGIFAN